MLIHLCDSLFGAFKVCVSIWAWRKWGAITQAVLPRKTKASVVSANAPKHMFRFKWQSPLAAEVIMTLVGLEQRRKQPDIVREPQCPQTEAAWVAGRVEQAPETTVSFLLSLNHYDGRVVVS